MKKIILTGGGSAGHVTPNLALLPALKTAGFSAEYIGGKNSIEQELLSKTDIPYSEISTGKLRRDKLLSLKNIGDVFNTVKGVGDASKVIKRIKPDIIFSKGGFVSVPVAIAGKLNKVPVILHESDITPGLANKISSPFASAICATFPETMQLLPKSKSILTGTPIRESLFSGNPNKALSLCGFNGNKPIILIMGGSLGSEKINIAVRQTLNTLLKTFDIIHLCGKGKIDREIGNNTKGYVQFEYVNDELSDILAACHMVVSRAGSNAINEFLALRRPSLLIPLANRATRGDQPLNAASFENQGFSKVLKESDLTPSSLINSVMEVYEHRNEYVHNMENSSVSNSISEIMKIILKFS